jgi:hypothetical protein
MLYFGGSSHIVTTPNLINALFSSSFVAPNSTKHSAVDTWNNVKIPNPRSVFNQSNDDLRMNPWQIIDPASTTYSSFIGVPLWNIPAQGTANFTLEYPVFETDCQWQLPGYTGQEWCELSGTLLSGSDPYLNTTCVVNETTGVILSGPTYDGQSFLQSNWVDAAGDKVVGNNPGELPKYVDILFGVTDSHQIGDIRYYGSKSSCTIRTAHVEAEVLCTDHACGVSRVRRSEKDLRPDYLTPVSPFALSEYHYVHLC